MKIQLRFFSFIGRLFKVNSYLVNITKLLLLSWFYALSFQINIWLPFNPVPISLQTFVIFFCTLLFGWPAVYAYIITLFQTALGAPFFSGFEGGFIKLIGPTGGYIWGFLLSMIFLSFIKDYKSNNFLINLVKLFFANLIFYSLGLLQLSIFVSHDKLFLLGVFPFIIGDLLKMIICAFLITKYNLLDKV